MKKLIFLLLSSMAVNAQRSLNFTDFLVLGVEKAENLTAIYLEPLNQGLMYGLTGGWYNSAQVKSPWELDISLVTNGSFVPSDKLSWTINIENIDNLEVANGANVVSVPTILGSRNSNITFLASLGEEDVQFEAPTGIGLLYTNWLPSAMLQATLGLPGQFEVGVRYFPKLHIDDFSVGAVGASLKYELTAGINGWEKFPVALSLFTAYTRLDAQYDFQANGFITGSAQHVDGYLNSWLFEAIFSTKNPKWNLYGGAGYITGTSEYALKGIYTIQVQEEVLNFKDPFDVQNNISGVRAIIGGKVNLGRFSINMDYTMQGYNNLSLGFNYKILKGKKFPSGDESTLENLK